MLLIYFPEEGTEYIVIPFSANFKYNSFIKINYLKNFPFNNLRIEITSIYASNFINFATTK
jgi:hypothetical protein